MKFRIWTILWVFALLASAMALFRWLGALIAVFVLLNMASLAFFNRNKPHPYTAAELLLPIAIGGFVLGISTMHTGYYSSLHKREWCQQQMQDLAFAIKHYRRRFGELPRDIQTESGKSLTWRIHLLPDLGFSTLVEKHNLGLEWNGAVTANLVQDDVFGLHCCVWASSHGTGKEAAYFAVKGPETYWMEDSSPWSDHQADYTQDTVMLIEANPDRGHWFEPRDLTLDEALHLLTNEAETDWEKPDGHWVNEMSPWRAFFYKPSFSRNVAMADGSVRTLYTPLPEKLARAILTDRQDEMDRSELDRYSQPQLDFSRIWGGALFSFIVVLPAFYHRRRKSIT